MYGNGTCDISIKLSPSAKDGQIKIYRYCRGFTLIEVMIVVAIVSILALIALPEYASNMSRVRAKTCRANLKQINVAKEVWSVREGTDDEPTWDEIVPDYLNPRRYALQAANIP